MNQQQQQNHHLEWTVAEATHARIQRGWQGVWTPEKSQTLGFLINTGPDPMKNHKATNPAFKTRRRKNNNNKKRSQKWTPSENSFWIRACHVRKRGLLYILPAKSAVVKTQLLFFTCVDAS